MGIVDKEQIIIYYNSVQLNDKPTLFKVITGKH